MTVSISPGTAAFFARGSDDSVARSAGDSVEDVAIRDILAGLDRLTVARQRRAMNRVCRGLRDQWQKRRRAFGLRNQLTVSGLLESLHQEARRPSPDVRDFVSHAFSLLALIRVVA